MKISAKGLLHSFSDGALISPARPAGGLWLKNQNRLGIRIDILIDIDILIHLICEF